MRYLFLFISTLVTPLAVAQNTTFGTSTTLTLGEKAIFYTGASTVFSGVLDNDGEILAYSDLDFTSNKNVGNIQLVGVMDQKLIGDTLVIDTLTIDKQGKVLLETSQVIVNGLFDAKSGIVAAENEEDFMINGDINTDGIGYVSGTMTAFTADSPVTFPVGIGDFANYVTLTSSTPGIEIKIECKLPDINALIADEETEGLADEVEWTIQTLSDSAIVTLEVSYAGVDLNNVVGGQFIRAKKYATTLQLYNEEDSLFHALTTGNVAENEISSRSPESSGRIVTTDVITVTTKPMRLAIGISPVQVGPEFFVPNVFSPNGTSEKNRTLRPFFSSEDITKLDFRILDSFNNEVYNTSMSSEALDLSQVGWDGVLKSGLDAPEGVYYYKIRLVSAEEGAFNKVGSVMLVR